ncbi:protein lin-54 homolog [Chrysoperla carnea]|uniref:protein lin-54 homolog n=1 Tax=Chrysoperla carnea TaxID=189513 RepID=UPI001D071B2C|nr:protein lin-54 homolog [Chrysoperla carnea]
MDNMEDSGISESEVNLTSLRRDLDNIASLQAELLTMNSEDDADTNEMELETESTQEDVVIDDVEVEIETEQASSPTASSPDIKEQQIKIVTTGPTSTLKAIAPKPITASIAQKTTPKTNIINTGGQQIVLIQSPGGTANAVSLSTGQPIKLISQTGQPVTLPQFQARQQLVKTTDGNLILRTALPKGQTSTQATLKTNPSLKRIVQTSPMTQKKMFVTTPGAQTIKTEPTTQMVKIITNTPGSTSMGNPSKTISLSQAQEMGLLTSTQVQQLLPHTVGNKIIINKSGQTKPTTQLVKVATSQFQKSPTKILPAPKFVQKPGGQQKVLIKQGNQLKTGIINTGQQVLRIPASQLNSSGQIHQINLPGQGVQYVRLVNTSNSNQSNTSAASSTVVTSTSGSTLVRTTTASGQQKVQTIVPVALVDRTGNISQGQSIVKVVPMSTNQTATTTVRPVAPKTVTTLGTTQRTIVASSGNTQGKIAAVPVSTVNTIQGTTILPTSPGNSIVMLPTQFVQLQQQQDINRNNNTVPKVSPKIEKLDSPAKLTTEAIIQEYVGRPSSTLEPNGLRPRKPCNCTKSQCLKLYCDCFANGEFCHMCNCVNCFNNLENEEERQKAIRSCLERNPSAFRPKIGKGRDAGEAAIRKHTKGCNCKRSGCLKNYCECYEAKIACSNNCKCVGCRNIEDSLEKKSLRRIAPLISLNDNNANNLGLKQSTPTNKLPTAIPYHKGRYLGYNTPNVEINFRPMLGNNTKQAFAFMTTEVIEATVQCLLASAETAEKKGLNHSEVECTVLKEFGRCLVEIINTAKS